MTTHWHVKTHSDDDDVAAFEAVFTALGYVGQELTRATDNEYEMITAYGGAGEFEDAYKAFVRTERFAGMAANATTISEQHSTPNLRAPLYATPDEPANLARLDVAARHAVELVNGEGPDGFAVWECAVWECAPDDES